MKKAISILTLSFILTSCATIVPQITRDNDDNRCNLVSKKLTLDVIPHSMSNIDCNDAVDCVAILGLGALYTATTGIISTSIVLVGNTVHWLEKQGKCDSSFLNLYITSHNQALLKNNGQLVRLAKE